MIGALRGKKQSGEERSSQERKIQSLMGGGGADSEYQLLIILTLFV